MSQDRECLPTSTVAAQLAAAREAGKREGMGEAIRILDALPRSVTKFLTGTTIDLNTSAHPGLMSVACVPTVDEGAAAIRAKLEEK